MTISRAGSDCLALTITGYEIREAIRRAEFRRLAQVNRFEESCVAFAGEAKEGPAKITESIEAEDMRLSALRELQSAYNLSVRVPFDNNEVTLAYLVASIRTAGVLESLWRKLVAKKRDRYERVETQRSKDTEYARPTYTQDEAFANATKTAEAASKIRAMIASYNSTAIDLLVHKSLVAPDAKGKPRLV